MSSKGLYHDTFEWFGFILFVKPKKATKQMINIQSDITTFLCHHLPHKIPVSPMTFYEALMPSCMEAHTVTRGLQHLFTFIKY